MKAVNLLPSEQRGSAKTTAAAATPASGGSAFGAYVVLGVLAFAVAALALYTLAGNVIKDRKAELAKVTQEASETQAKAAALQSYADFKQLATQRVATVKSLADSRFNWERTLGDLARAVPGDVHLTSLDGTIGTEVSGGSGGSGLRSAVQAPALELQGCTTTQSSVAQLMSRLRNVRGVTRVSLSKSDKDGTAIAAPSAQPDGSTPAQLCPKGAPPSFDVLVFFERAVVSPNAAPNTTTGATTGTTAAPAAGAAPAATPAAAAPAATPAAGTTTSTTPSTTEGVSAK